MDNIAPITVPAGHLFMMGDNRDNSLDSRVAIADGGVGMVPVENLMARADLMIGSYDFLNAHAVQDWPGQIRLTRSSAVSIDHLNNPATFWQKANVARVSWPMLTGSRAAGATRAGA